MPRLCDKPVDHDSNIFAIMDSCCIYRFPKTDTIYFYKGDSKKGIFPGFVIAPFDLNDGIYTITDLYECNPTDISEILKSSNDASLTFPLPDLSTTEAAHHKIVKGIQNILNGDLSKKIIASKVIVKSGSIDLEKSFESLCESFPEAFIFLFYTPETGIWIGASPEILLNCENSILSTYALAGTRPACTIGNWDDKNIKEQAIVKNYIVDIFQSFGLTPSVSDTKTRKAGSIEHLLTEIISPLDASNNIVEILRALSPTPALSGYPKEMAMQAIKMLEDQPRGYYGGFIGPYKNAEDFNFFVNLRSIRIAAGRYCMHVGGGITALSDAKEEWIETERKAASIFSSLKLKN
ncbi:MAG: chorismate-binding protein [Muribaculaceae bacterium]|nr:chorismate-binding protein [Muribaculaceae bacterium]